MDEETVRHEAVYGARDTYASTENPMLEMPRKRKEPISRAKKETENIASGRTAEVSEDKGVKSQVSSRASSRVRSAASRECGESNKERRKNKASMAEIAKDQSTLSPKSVRTMPQVMMRQDGG